MNTWNRHIRKMFTNVHKHRNPKNTQNTWQLSFGSGTKLLFTFLSLRFFDMRRERHNFFLCWLFHLTPTTCGTPPQTTGLASASSENQLASSKPKSQLTAFFQIPKSSAHRFRAWRHSRPRSHFLSEAFIVTSVIVTFALHVREHLDSMCAPN